MQSVVQRQFGFFILVIVSLSTLTTAATSSLSHLVNLIPFDVSIVLVSDSATATKVDTATVTTLVTSDLTVCIQNISSSLYALDQILLEEINSVETRRRLTTTKNYIATFKGVSIWKNNVNNTIIPDATIVAGFEVTCLTTARTRLLARFTNENGSASGLGSSVVDVRATINPNADTTTTSNGNSNGGGGLDVVIIVAICIASIAVLLLLFACYMAWNGNRQRTAKKSGSTTVQDSYDPAVIVVPSEIGSGNDNDNGYPESVISEDISTSLTAYYKSGTTTNMPMSLREKQQASYLNDAASVSSMESYGYSLDGYASSIGGGGHALAMKK